MIGNWLPEGWEGRRGEPMLTDEKLMRKFGVPVKEILTLDVHDGAGHVAKLERRPRRAVE